MYDQQLKGGRGESFGWRSDRQSVHVRLGVRFQPHQHRHGCAATVEEGPSSNNVVDGRVHTLEYVDVQSIIDDLADPRKLDGLASFEDLLALEGLRAPVLPLGEEVCRLQFEGLRELSRDDR
jgi:hypothetical protein